MNGKQMLEAMSFVDEKYIEDAEAAPKRNRIHWQGFAAAAWQWYWQGFGV